MGPFETLFMTMGIFFSVVIVISALHKLFANVSGWVKKKRKRREVAKKLPPNWKINYDAKLLDLNHVYVIRDDGAYIKVDRGLGFMHLIWQEQDLRAFVSHWNEEEKKIDLELPGDWYASMDMADKYFPMGVIVTEPTRVTFSAMRGESSAASKISKSEREAWEKAQRA